MTTTLRTIAALAIVAVALHAPAAVSAQNNGAEPSVPDVCLIAYELCTAGCNAANPDSGLNFNEYISNQVCMRQCVDQLNSCIATGGTGTPARKFSVKKLVGPIFGMDGTPSHDSNPASDSKPPVEPGNDQGRGGRDEGGVFDPGANHGGGLSLFSAD